MGGVVGADVGDTVGSTVGAVGCSVGMLVGAVGDSDGRAVVGVSVVGVVEVGNADGKGLGVVACPSTTAINTRARKTLIVSP